MLCMWHVKVELFFNKIDILYTDQNMVMNKVEWDDAKKQKDKDIYI